jgi:hypothetical protein
MVAWQDAFWAAQPPGGHLILTASRPGIYDCFNQADLLITDVSSVVSDFLASAKPYAVINTSGLSEDEFKTVNPTVRAATIIGLSAAEIPHLLATVRDPRLDTLAEERARLKEHLLGPADPPSLARFQAAAVALCAAAEARRVSQGLPPVPSQDERGERSESAEGEQSVRNEENEEEKQAQQDQPRMIPTPRASRTGAAL